MLCPQEFVEIAQYWISVAANRQRMRNLTMEYSDFLTIEMLLYVKDRILLSDRSYFYFYHALYLNWLFSKRCNVASVRSRINKFLTEKWQVELIVNGTQKIGWKCNNIKELLLHMLKIELKESKTIPDRLRIKISGDGRRNNGGQNILSINPLNLSQFDTQRGHSIFPVLFWKGKENIIRNIAASTFQHLYACQVNGVPFHVPVRNRTRHVSVDILWSSDLCFLDSISDEYLYTKTDMCCPYCCVTKENVNNFSRRYNRRRITIFGKEIQVLICTLHAKQAITRRLLHNMFLLYSNDTQRINKIEKTIAAIPGLYGFKMQIENTPSNPMEEYDDDDYSQFDNGKIKVPK
jgi:hypothetical protein